MRKLVNKGLTDRQIAKKKIGICVSHACPNNRRDGNFCNKCIKRKQSAKNPIRTSYYNLRTNAKRRGKEFNLTLEEFTKFAIETEYINKRGKTAKSYSIDRMDNSKGYSIDNIMVLTLSENSIKQNKIDYSDVPF